MKEGESVRDRRQAKEKWGTAKGKEGGKEERGEGKSDFHSFLIQTKQLPKFTVSTFPRQDNLPFRKKDDFKKFVISTLK